MGAVVELTDEEWGLVEHLFDSPVHRGVNRRPPVGLPWVKELRPLRGLSPVLSGRVEWDLASTQHLA